MIVKVATKEDAEKLLTSNNVSFGGGAIIISPFKERCTPIADRIRTVTLGSNFSVRILSESSGSWGGEVAKTLLKHLFY